MQMKKHCQQPKSLYTLITWGFNECQQPCTFMVPIHNMTRRGDCVNEPLASESEPLIMHVLLSLSLMNAFCQES